MTYLVDGTNVVRRLYQDNRRAAVAEEEGHIEEFLEWVGWAAARRKGRGFRVAFDGPPRSCTAWPGVQLFWGREEGADAVLLDQVRYLVHGGEKVVLVTADHALAEQAEREGAESMLPEAFSRKLQSGG